MTKQELRKKIIRYLLRIPKPVLQEQSDNLIRKLKDLPQFQAAKNVLLYASHDYELPTHSFIKEFLKKKNVFLPKIRFFPKPSMAIYQLLDWKQIHKGSYGILEPPDDIQGQWDEMDIALIPGIAFTRDGKRLGQGKGFYDKFLSRPSPALTVALALPDQIVIDIPTEQHDKKIDVVIT